MPIIDKISNLGEGRKLKRLEELARLVNTYEPETEELSDDELRAKTNEFRTRATNGESLDDLLPEGFAVAREAARRTIGQRHFDVQLMGGVALHQGNIAEMKTGEGKTLVSTLPGYLNALGGGGVHLVTVNDYLAKRDSEWMGGIYRFLGLDVGPDPGVDDTRAAATRLRRRHHVRHEQRVRVRLPARQHGDAHRSMRPARPHVRDRRRGRLDPDRRGPHPADHLRHGVRLREVVPDVRAGRAAPHRGPGLRGRRVEIPGRGDRGGRREGGGDPPDRQPLRQRQHDARASPSQRAARQGALQARRRLRRDRRRGQDRRRVHRPRPRGPPLLGGPAPGDRGQRGRQDQGREPDARDDHDPELLQDVRQALGDDRDREDAAHRVRGDLQDRRRRDPDEPAEGPRRPAGPVFKNEDAKWNAVADDIIERNETGSRSSSARSRSRSPRVSRGAQPARRRSTTS